MVMEVWLWGSWDAVHDVVVLIVCGVEAVPVIISCAGALTVVKKP